MKKNQEQKLGDYDDDDRDDDKSGSKAAFVVTTKACVGLSTQRGPGTTTSQSGTIFVTTYNNTQFNTLYLPFINIYSTYYIPHRPGTTTSKSRTIFVTT